MHYRVDEKKYVNTLTQFIDKENPPEYILCYEVRSRVTLMSLLDMFPNSKFYIVDEPYFIRLLLKWPKKDYSKRILGYEMIQTEEDIKVEKLQNGLEAILEKAGVENLTVIMNPPYGSHNSIVKKVIDSVLDCKKVSETICLAPTNAFKKAIKHVSEFTKVDNFFDNIAIDGISLAIAKLLPKEVNKFSFEDVMLEKDEVKLFEAIQRYNKFSKSQVITSTGNYVGKKQNITLKNLYELVELHTCFQKIENKTLKQLDEEKYIFYTTCFTPLSGVHVTEDCWDYKLNVLNEDFPEELLYKNRSVNLHIFKDKDSRNNFRDWWYSCNLKRTTGKRIGLTNKILDIIVKMFSGSAGTTAYLTCFPNLDWSRPWTDEEIIQELKDKAGLPKDWSLKY